MDAERVKEIVFKAVEDAWVSLRPANMSAREYFKWEIEKALAKAEAVEDSEPNAERDRHWQKRAEYFAGRLDSHDSLTEDEANSIRFMQIRDRIADVDAMLSERVDKLEKDAVEDAHALIDLHCRIEKVDTAFSDTLKGYLGRLDVVAGWKELHTAYHRTKEDEGGSQTLSKQ